VNLGNPSDSILGGVSGAVLTVLAKTTLPLTGPSIASISTTSVSRAGVNRVMADLVESGLVNAVQAGKAKLYSLNRLHVAANAIQELASLRETLFQRIRDQVDTWNITPISVVLFGSTARGDATSKSDVDLLIVPASDLDVNDADWSADLATLSALVQSWSGNGCELLEYSWAEVKRLAQSGEPLFKSIRTEGISLYGLSVATLLDKGKRA
jgi:predicted nucleotidyltransferase